MVLYMYLVICSILVMGNSLLLPPTTQSSALTDQHYNFLLNLLAEEKQLRHQLEQIVSNQQTDLYNMSKIISQMQMSEKESCKLVEVARGKVTTESHQYTNFVPGLAVDGRLDTFSHTPEEIQPWIMIDLGQVYDIQRIEVYNRLGCCGERLKSLLVSVGNTTYAFSWCGYFQGPATNGQHIVFTCPLVGRHVKLMINDNDPKSVLHLAEVLVYARP